MERAFDPANEPGGTKDKNKGVILSARFTILQYNYLGFLKQTGCNWQKGKQPNYNRSTECVYSHA